MIDVLNIDTETLQLAVQESDIPFQLDMFQEECAEAIVAVNHYRRNRVDAMKVAEEIADVYIMCQKMAMIVGVHLVDQQVLFKMQRLRDRIADRLKKVASKLV